MFLSTLIMAGAWALARWLDGGFVSSSDSSAVPISEVVPQHRIIMLGGRRSGKSTILAEMLFSLKAIVGDLCVFDDKTDYTDISKLQLKNKEKELKSYFEEEKQRSNKIFTLDIGPTNAAESYIIELAFKGKKIGFEFVDIPGEWMRNGGKDKDGKIYVPEDHKRLKELIRESDVFIIAIDTPFLMNESKAVNNIYNQINSITQALQEIRILNAEFDLKQIILCPVKCEKWIQTGKINDVIEKIKIAYGGVIKPWVTRDAKDDAVKDAVKDAVEIEVIPVQTVGGIEFAKMLPASLCHTSDGQTVKCSRDDDGRILLCDGTELEKNKQKHIEEDKEAFIDYCSIPRAWYKFNDKGYSPFNCEQPGLHIFRFLIKKEEKILRAKRNTAYMSHGCAWRFFHKKFISTFGNNIAIWKELFKIFNTSGLIKDDEDGIIFIRENCYEKKGFHQKI